MDLVSHGHLLQKHSLFLHNYSKQHPIIDIRDNVGWLGIRKSQVLIGLHYFIGADWGEKMVGIGKATWIKRLLSPSDDDPILTSIIKLGKGEITKVLVCLAYSNTSSSPDSIPALRWHLYPTKIFEGENFPPTQASLLPQESSISA